MDRTRPEWNDLEDTLELAFQTPAQTVRLKASPLSKEDEWAKLQEFIQGRHWVEDAQYFWGYPIYTGPPSIIEESELAKAETHRLRLTPGTDRDWQISFAPLRFGASLWSRFFLWPALLVPRSLTWVLESPAAMLESFFYGPFPDKAKESGRRLAGG